MTSEQKLGVRPQGQNTWGHQELEETERTLPWNLQTECSLVTPRFLTLALGLRA